MFGYFSRRLIRKVSFTPSNEIKFPNHYKNVPKFVSPRVQDRTDVQISLGCSILNTLFFYNQRFIQKKGD